MECEQKIWCIWSAAAWEAIMLPQAKWHPEREWTSESERSVFKFQLYWYTSKRSKSKVWMRYVYVYVHNSDIQSSLQMEATKLSIGDEWINKM